MVALKNPGLLEVYYSKHRFVLVLTPDGCAEKSRLVRSVPQGGLLSATLFNTMLSIKTALPKTAHSTIGPDDLCSYSSSVSRNVAPVRLQKAVHAFSRQLASLELRVSAKETTTMTPLWRITLSLLKALVDGVI